MDKSYQLDFVERKCLINLKSMLEARLLEVNTRLRYLSEVENGLLEV